MAKRRLTIRPMGGVGNQLFIWAHGFSLSHELDAQLMLDTSWFTGQRERFFELPALIPDVSLGATIASTMTSRTAYRKHALVANGYLPRWTSPRLILETTAEEHDRWLLRPSNLASFGYFQSAAYFTEWEEQIRSIVKLGDTPSQWYREASESLDALDSWTAVHFRRGDYMRPENQAVHGLLQRSYYVRALEELHENGISEPIVVFTDDPALAEQELFGLAENQFLIDPNLDGSAAETLILMSQARHMILANSSLSWWAAFIGERPSQRVVAPKDWCVARQARAIHRERWKVI